MFAGDDDALLYLLVSFYRAFYFTKFDPGAKNLYLVIGAAPELECSVFEKSTTVSSPVQTQAWRRRKRVRNKPLSRELRSLKIATRQIVSANIYFPNDSNRHRLKASVQNIKLCVRDRPAQGNAFQLFTTGDLVITHIRSHF